MSATLAHAPHREQIPAAGLLLLTLRRWSTRKQKNTISLSLSALGYAMCLRKWRTEKDCKERGSRSYEERNRGDVGSWG
ncbi:hypothetical protein Cni_G00602 [Canna indica]|uniref:Uncharacterized protein n=1 Tax=Canna indica TaxID=4628 RepID=A0AAQ3JL32_9LILI|nr:hypothetical protein Cni_G00602 [Canna indica]